MPKGIKGFQKGHKGFGRFYPPMSTETKEKISEAKKGQIPWNKNTKGICKPNSGSFKKGHPNSKKAHKFLKGEKHWNWKGGIRKINGYVYLYNSTHPFTTKQGYIKRSRLVMEQYLERYLRPKEVVHHINEIKDDDRIENLKLFANESKHQKYHWKIKKVLLHIS